jgi:DNA-binding CsgD family transcriptional regulator
VEILRMVALDLSNKEIAERLSMSEHTVKYTWGRFLGA